MSIWQRLSQVLSHKEKITVNILILVVIASLIATIVGLYYHFTRPIPISGGDYSEGIVGQPMYINPVLASGNEADADLCQLVYSSLFKYDTEGKVIPDLAESYETDKSGLTYTIKLKKDVKWHDGEPLTADDVLFTYQLIQDPATKSPLRQRWQGIGMEMVDESVIKFVLPSPYVFFVENNLTTGILPKHVWETVAPGNFSLVEYNLRPVGTGPYKFSDFEKDSGGMILSYDFTANSDYFGDKPYIAGLHFEFYPDEDLMLDDFNNKKTFGMGSLTPENLEKIKSRRSINVHSINLPRYFAVFFNQQKSKILANREVRKAFSLSTDRKEIINQVLAGHGREIYSPILLNMFGFSNDIKKFEFDPGKAEKVLEDDGWKKEGDVRKKDGLALEFTLVTTDWPPLQKTAEILKLQWEKIGAKVNVESLSVGEIQQNYIRPREYEAVLFGQSWAGLAADPFPLWHSSRTRDPGLNLALYSNTDADKVMEKLREATKEEERLDAYKKFQQLLADDVPALFVYSPSHVYVTNKKVQGIGVTSAVSAQGRFVEVEKWYVKTKRIRK